MNEDLAVRQIDQDKFEDAFNIIIACALELSKNGFDHWEKYYSSPKKFADGVERNKSEVFVIYILEKPAATFTISTNPPTYFTNPETYPVDLETGKKVANVMHYFTPVESALYLSALAVHPQSQGKGVARLILNNIEDIAKERKIQSIRFDTRAEFAPANKLYISMGYKPVFVDVSEGEGESYVYYEKLLS